MRQRITFNASAQELQWLETEDGLVVDTSKDDWFDDMLRGAEVRNVVVGGQLEINYPHPGMDEWQIVPLDIISIE